MDYVNPDAGLRDQADAFVRDFATLEQDRDYASKVDDLEVLAKIRVVESFGRGDLATGRAAAGQRP